MVRTLENNYFLVRTKLGYLRYIKVKASQILHGGATPVAPSKKWIKTISIHLMKKTFLVFHIYSVTEEILSPATFITEWTSIGYCETSKFFWLIFLVSSPPSLPTMRFPHSSSMTTGLGECSKFSMISISI